MLESEEGPMAFVMDDIEADAVRWALQAYLPELRYEAARIKLTSHRHELVEIEQVLSRLASRLEAGAEADEVPAPHA
jgi:hypothetical protein